MTPVFQLSGHHHGGHPAEEGQGPVVRSDPGGQVAMLGGFGIGVVAGPERGHEQIGFPDLAGPGIRDGNGLSGMIDKQLVAAAVILAQDQIELSFPAGIELAVAAVLVAVGIDLLCTPATAAAASRACDGAVLRGWRQSRAAAATPPAVAPRAETAAAPALHRPDPRAAANSSRPVGPVSGSCPRSCAGSGSCGRSADSPIPVRTSV